MGPAFSTPFEAPEPILNTPFAEPAHHWYIREGEEPQKRPRRRPSIVYPPRDDRHGTFQLFIVSQVNKAEAAFAQDAFDTIATDLLRQFVRGGIDCDAPN